MVAARRYSRQPAVQIYTELYYVWCALSQEITAKFGFDASDV